MIVLPWGMSAIGGASALHKATCKSKLLPAMQGARPSLLVVFSRLVVAQLDLSNLKSPDYVLVSSVLHQLSLGGLQ